MLCIKCFSQDTRVANSRPSKKEPRIWRRRQCKNCGYTFTTHEFVALDDYLLVESKPFSVPRLALTIARFLNPHPDAADTAYWLARSVGEKILKLEAVQVGRDELIRETYSTLAAFDPAAGLRYGSTYGLVVPTARPRRGRPRLRRA